MKFPRHARIFRGQLDATPFAALLFLLVIFLLVAGLLYTPGVHLQLPAADDLPGTDKPTVTVAVDADNRYYFANQIITEPDLKARLRQAVTNSPEPLMLVVQADSAVTHASLVRLALLARDAGIRDSWLATLPRTLGPAAP